jgi:phosphorylcholine metabolism protein LicD
MIMNKILSVFLVFLISNSLSAQGQNGKVYLMRSEGFQAPAAAFNVFVDQKLVGRLSNKKFSIHEVKPGKHTFSIQFAGKKPSEKAEKIEEQIEAGKTYYIQVNFKHGIFKNKLHFKEVDESSAKKLLPGLKQV